jgi:quinol monooxygenase YgiN
VFAAHRALDDPQTFGLYETCADTDAVEAHGNTEPLAVLGFSLGTAGESHP